MGNPTLTRTRRESSGEAADSSQPHGYPLVGYAVQARSGRCLLTRCEMLANQSNNDQDEDDHEQDVNQIAGLGNPWDARRSEVSKEPENEKHDNDRLEHIPSRNVLSGMSNTGAD